MSNTKKDNMEIWNKLFPTNEKYLKAVKYGSREFTAIDPYYQIRKMTELFGPIGKGWGYHIQVLDSPPELVAVKLSLQYGQVKGESGALYDSQRIEVLSAARTHQKNGNIDDDCYKKVVTDALTKAFSLLGMDAGVFLGQYAGNKYIGAKDEPDEAAEPATPSQIGYLKRLATDQNIVIGQIVEKLGFNLKTLTKPQASDVIEHLKGNSS